MLRTVQNISRQGRKMLQENFANLAFACPLWGLREILSQLNLGLSPDCVDGSASLFHGTPSQRSR